MHPKTFLASAAAILPIASALATNGKGSYLETDAYSARAAINQRDYLRNSSPKSWAVCNDKNTVVRKEWYVYVEPFTIGKALTRMLFQERIDQEREEKVHRCRSVLRQTRGKDTAGRGSRRATSLR